MTESKYGRYVVTELQFPKERSSIKPIYDKYATRILWMDENVVPGAFKVNASWYFKAGNTLEDAPHIHDADEMLGFFGNDTNNPRDLGGEIEIWLEGRPSAGTSQVNGRCPEKKIRSCAGVGSR